MTKHPLVIAFVVAVSLVAPASAQTPLAGSAGAGNAAISGVPAGPGSVGGINNSVNDPSGIGNAARMAPPVSSGATGPATTLQRPVVVPPARSRPVRLSRINGRRLSEAQQEAVVKENDKLLSRKLRSICTGC